MAFQILYSTISTLGKFIIVTNLSQTRCFQVAGLQYFSIDPITHYDDIPNFIFYDQHSRKINTCFYFLQTRCSQVAGLQHFSIQPVVVPRTATDSASVLSLGPAKDCSK